MTIVALPPAQNMTLAGLLVSLTAADAGGNKFGNNGQQFIQVKNADSGAHTCTPTPYPGGGQLPPPGVVPAGEPVSIAAGATKLIGPFDPAVFNDGTNSVQLVWDAVTSVTVGVVQFQADTQ